MRNRIDSGIIGAYTGLSILTRDINVQRRGTIVYFML